MADPITYGVIGGLLESMLMGQAAESEAKKKAAEREQEKADKQYENGMTFFTDSLKSQKASEAFLSSFAAYPENAMIFDSLTPYHRSAIINYAVGDIEQPAYDAAVLARITTPEAASNFMTDAKGYSKLLPRNQNIIAALGSIKISDDQRDLLKSAPTDRNEKLAYFKTLQNVYGDTSFGTMLSGYITGLEGIKQLPTYEKIDFSTVKSMLDQTVDNEGNTLENVGGVMAQLQKLKTQIAPFAFGENFDERLVEGATGIDTGTPQFSKSHPDAVQDYIMVDMAMKAYASRGDDEDEPLTAIDFMEGALDTLKAMQTKRGGEGLSYTAGQYISIVKTKLEFDPETATPEELEKFRALEGYTRDVNEVAANTMVFGSGSRQLKIDDPMNNPLQSLMKLDQNVNIKDVYNSLEADEKFEFETLVKQLIMLDQADTGTATTRQGGVTEQRPETNFVDVLPNLYDNLPFVKKFLHENLQYGSNGTKTVSVPQLADDGVTPLGEDSFRVNDTLVVQASPALKAIAKSRNKTVQNLLLTDSVIFGMLDVGSDNPMKLFEAAKGYQDSGIFANRTDMDLRTTQHSTLAYVSVSRGIIDRNDQLDAIAVNMDGSLPRQYQPEFGVRGITKEQYSAFLQKALGRSIDLDDISQARVNSETFLDTADEVEFYLVDRLPPGSRAYDEVAATLLNLFGVEDSFFDQVTRGLTGGIKKFFDPNSTVLFREEDMLVGDGGNAADVRANIIAQAEDFMKGNFLQTNAKLKASLITLAYNYAKTMDPSGRISERDFGAALEAVSAGNFDTRETQIATVRRLITQARDNIVFHSRVFDVASSVRGGTRYYDLTEDNIRRIRAMRHFGPLKRVTRGMEQVKTHTDIADRVGSDYLNDATWASMFAIDNQGAYERFGEAAVDNGIAVLKMRIGPRTQSHPMGSGVPIYFFKSSGKILTAAQIRQYSGQGA